MAVALTPDACLYRTPDTAWDEYYSACGWVRLDADRGEYTILAYLGNIFISRGFQWTVDPDRQLVVFRLMDFADLLGGAGPTLEVGEWWFFGITTIGPDVPNNINLYYGKLGDSSLTQATVSFSGTYDYRWHGVGCRPADAGNGEPGPDGEFDAYRLHGSVWGWRTWQNVTLTPSQMLAEFESATPVLTTGLWSSWPLEDADTAGADVAGSGRDLTVVTGTGTITDTDGPFDGGAQQGERDATAHTGPVAAGSSRSAAGVREVSAHVGPVAAATDRAFAGARDVSAHTGPVSAAADRGASGDRSVTATTGQVSASGERQAAGIRTAQAHTGPVSASAEREALAATRDATAWTGTAAATADRTAASGVREVTAHTGSIAAAAERETPGSTRDVTATTGPIAAGSGREAAGTRQTGSHTGQIAATASRTVPGATRDATAHTGRTAASGSRVGHAHRAGSGHVRPVVASADAAGVTRTRDVTAHARRCVASGSRTGRTVREATCTARRITAEAATFIPPDEPAARVRFVTRTRPLATMEVTT